MIASTARHGCFVRSNGSMYRRHTKTKQPPSRRRLALDFTSPPRNWLEFIQELCHHLSQTGHILDHLSTFEKHHGIPVFSLPFRRFVFQKKTTCIRLFSYILPAMSTPGYTAERITQAPGHFGSSCRDVIRMLFVGP